MDYSTSYCLLCGQTTIALLPLVSPVHEAVTQQTTSSQNSQQWVRENQKILSLIYHTKGAEFKIYEHILNVSIETSIYYTLYPKEFCPCFSITVFCRLTIRALWNMTMMDIKRTHTCTHTHIIWRTFEILYWRDVSSFWFRNFLY